MQNSTLRVLGDAVDNGDDDDTLDDGFIDEVVMPGAVQSNVDGERETVLADDEILSVYDDGLDEIDFLNVSYAHVEKDILNLDEAINIVCRSRNVPVGSFHNRDGRNRLWRARHV